MGLAPVGIHTAGAVELIDDDDVEAEPPQAERPRETLPGDAAVSIVGGDAATDEQEGPARENEALPSDQK